MRFYVKNKKNYLKTILLILAGVCIALLSSMIGVRKLSAYIGDEFYQLSRMDFFNQLLVTDEFQKYPYLSRTDMDLLFMPIAFYFVSVAIACGDFLLKPQNYFTYIYARVKSKQVAMKYIKGKGHKNVVVFIFSYFVSLYVLSFFTFLRGNVLGERELILYLFLRMMNSIVIVLAIRECVFYLWCKKGVSIAFLFGIVFLMILLLMDIASNQFNILLFNRRNYFIDGIMVGSILCFILNWLCNKVELPF